MKRLFLAFCASLLLFGQEKVDLYVVNRIKAEAFRNSKVMESAFYLTDVYGPRLTGSPQYQAAAEWSVKRLQDWGFTGAQLEKWGPFGRTWSNIKFSAAMKEPQYTPLIAVPRPWSRPISGVLSGDPILAVIRNDADMEKFKGKLRGKIVLIEQPRVLQPSTEVAPRRFTEAELAAEALAPDPSQSSPFASPIPRTPDNIPGLQPGQPFDREAVQRFRNKLNKYLNDEGVLLTIVPSPRTDYGTIFAGPAGSRDPKDPVPPPSVAMTSEHYDRIARLIDKKVPCTLEFEIQNRIDDVNHDSVNVTAELPGTDKKDEIVMIGAHLDSWTFGTGATDNGAGSAVMLEVMRILKALDLKMARTVRIGLWSGEEQGLLGSREYVKQHFADRETMQLKPEHAKLSGYFNFDNGTGKIRGVFLQSNDMMRPVFEQWLAPFKDLGATAVTIRNTGGTDHLSFDAVGLPGFQFIQDPVEYSTRTHHSNMDVYDRLQPGDLMQASAIIASVVYDAATRPEMLPRKPLPKPQPRPQERKPDGPNGQPTDVSAR